MLLELARSELAMSLPSSYCLPVGASAIHKEVKSVAKHSREALPAATGEWAVPGTCDGIYTRTTSTASTSGMTSPSKSVANAWSGSVGLIGGGR